MATDRTPYRSAPVSGTIVLRVGQSRVAVVGGALLAVALTLGSAWTWAGESIVHRPFYVPTEEHDGCIPRLRLVSNATPLREVRFCDLADAVEASDSPSAAELKRESPVSRLAAPLCSPDHRGAQAPLEVRLARVVSRGRLLLFVMALIALLASPLLTQRATVTLDESARRIRIARSLPWRKETVERPLGSLRRAAVVTGWLSTCAQLEFENGETLEVAAPTLGDGGQAALVTAVTRFVERAAEG